MLFCRELLTEFVTMMVKYYLIQDASPALTFKIEQEYFENNISDDDNNFVLADGFYSRTIEQDELTLAFDDTDDGQFNRR